MENDNNSYTNLPCMPHCASLSKQSLHVGKRKDNCIQD